MQGEALESNLLLFETFSLIFYFLPEQFLEELALLKIQNIQTDNIVLLPNITEPGHAASAELVFLISPAAVQTIKKLGNR